MALTLVVLNGTPFVSAQTRRASPPPRPKFYTTTLTLEQMQNKQAVVETSKGTFVIALLPEAAPNHVGYFIELAKKGAFNGTTFHRALRLGLVQAGDPISKDPAKRALFGTGGLGVLQFQKNDLKHVRGAVSAVLRPGEPDSAGSQFFVCISDQPTLDGQYTVFGRVVEGLDVPQEISTLPTDASQFLTDRVVITAVTIRDTPPPEPTPFADDPAEALAKWRAVLETTMGAITLEMFPGSRAGARAELSAAREAGRLRRHVVPSHCAWLRRADRVRRDAQQAADRETAVVRDQRAARVQRHEARARHRLDGARRQSRKRTDVVLHLYRSGGVLARR